MSSYSSYGADIYRAADPRQRIGFRKSTLEAMFDSMEQLRSVFDAMDSDAASNAMAGAIDIAWAYMTCEIAGEPLPNASPEEVHAYWDKRENEQ